MSINVIGISNLGNTCWLATLSQFLASSQYFISACSEYKQKEETAQNIILREFDNMRSMRENHIHIFSGEFLRMMSNHDLDSSQKSILDACLILINQLPTSAQNQFMMRFQSLLFCTCGYNSSTRYENYFAPVTPSNVLFVDQLLNNYAQTEAKCPKCNQKMQKIDKITRAGENIILVVNKQNTDLEKNKKLIFPGKNGVQLKYNLIARAEHSGDTNGGHYWSICKRGQKHNRAPEYHILNDSQTIEIKEDIFTQSAKNTYMILYEKE